MLNSYLVHRWSSGSHRIVGVDGARLGYRAVAQFRGGRSEPRRSSNVVGVCDAHDCKYGKGADDAAHYLARRDGWSGIWRIGYAIDAAAADTANISAAAASAATDARTTWRGRRRR